MNLQVWLDFLRKNTEKLGRPFSCGVGADPDKTGADSHALWNKNSGTSLLILVHYRAWSVFGASDARAVQLNFEDSIFRQRDLFQDSDSPELKLRYKFVLRLGKRHSRPRLVWIDGDWECLKTLSPRFRSFLEGLLRAGRKRRRKPPSMLRISDMNARRFVLLAVREMNQRPKGL